MASETSRETKEVEDGGGQGNEADYHSNVTCDDCGEPVTLVSTDLGKEFGAECGCEREDGTRIGTYVEVAGRLPDQWSEDDHAE